MPGVTGLVPALFISWKGLLGTLLQETKRGWNRDSLGIHAKIQIPGLWNESGGWGAGGRGRGTGGTLVE